MADTTAYNITTDTIVFSAVKSNGQPDITNILYRLQVPPLSMKTTLKLRSNKGNVKNLSSSQKQPTGFEDIPVKVRLVLLDDQNGTALEKLSDLERIFKNRSQAIGTSSTSRKTVPRPYAIQSATTDAMKIRTVMVNTMDSNHVGHGTTTIEVDLSLLEFEPEVVPVEKQSWGFQDEVNQMSVWTNESSYYTGYETGPQSYLEESSEISGKLDQELGAGDPFSDGQLAAKKAFGG